MIYEKSRKADGNMKEKVFRISKEELKLLITPKGSGIASDQITVDGRLVGYMYRETAMADHDSGWRFFSGFESQIYVNDPDNLAFYDLNTIANHDPAIIPYLDFPIGTELERKGNDFMDIVKGK